MFSEQTHLFKFSIINTDPAGYTDTQMINILLEEYIEVNGVPLHF